MKYFCCDCGRPVPMRLVEKKWEVGRCREHPNAKRYSETYAAKWFDAMRVAMGKGPLAEIMGTRREVRAPYRAKHVSEIMPQLGGAS